MSRLLRATPGPRGPVSLQLGWLRRNPPGKCTTTGTPISALRPFDRGVHHGHVVPIVVVTKSTDECEHQKSSPAEIMPCRGATAPQPVRESGLRLRTRITAACCGLATGLGCNATVPADKAALMRNFAAQPAAVAARWPIDALTAVGTARTTGKPQRAAIGWLFVGCSESREDQPQTQNGRGQNSHKHGFLQ